MDREMIEGDKYMSLVKEWFAFLITEFNFELCEEKVKGNVFYDIRYKDLARTVSVSYENIEDYLLVIVFILENGKLPEYDDKTKTLHLTRLNERVLPVVDKKEIHLNSEYFSGFHAKNDIERRLLKSAKELRLCLKHFYEVVY